MWLSKVLGWQLCGGKSSFLPKSIERAWEPECHASHLGCWTVWGVLECRKVRLPVQSFPEPGRWRLSCLCVGDPTALGFGRVLQDLMTAYLAGKERRSQIALTRGLEQEVVEQIFLVWEEPEVDLASWVWKVNLLLPVNAGSASSCYANPDLQRYPSCQHEKTDDLGEDGCQALGHLVFHPYEHSL